MMVLLLFQTVLDTNTDMQTNPHWLLSIEKPFQRVVHGRGSQARWSPSPEPPYERHKLAGVWYLIRVGCQLPSPSGQSGIRITPPLLQPLLKATVQPKVVTPESRPGLTTYAKLESEGIKCMCNLHIYVSPRVERGHMGIMLQLITLTIFYYAQPPVASFSDAVSN